jgi:hypothetical protein
VSQSNDPEKGNQMNTLTKTLLAGSAFCALATVPALADKASAFHFVAQNGGRVVNKTALPHHSGSHVTYTFGVYSSIPSSDLHQTVRVANTVQRVCNVSSLKTKVDPKKTAYAKVGTFIETYSTGCALVGATYKLTNPDAKGNTDNFVFTVSGKFQQSGQKYKGVLNMDVSVSIE